jgi:hypothetical protein
MERNLKTTDATGFDYMANTGQEEKDRDTIGWVVAVIMVIMLTLFQFLGMY